MLDDSTSPRIVGPRTNGDRPSAGPVSLFVAAGESSGDHHAAGVVRALRSMGGEINAFGMGGTKLRSEGVRTVVDSETHASVMGLTEVVGTLGHAYRAYRTLVAEIDRVKPDLALLVDYPDFNFFLVRALHRRNVRILYYISPQLWAWRRGRIKTIKRYVDRVAPIFPFEESFYHAHGVEARYVGHPFLDRSEEAVDREAFLTGLELKPFLPVVALLPGSRKAEVERLLPPMAAAFEQVRRGRPGVQAIVPVADNLDVEWLRSLLPPSSKIRLVKGRAREALAVADAAVLASGTATVEAALAKVPFFVVYKLSPLSYRLGKLLVRGVRHFAMPNLIAGRRLVTELLQDEADAERIAAELENLLADGAYRSTLSRQLGMVRDRLQRGFENDPRSSAERVAELVLELIGERGGLSGGKERAAGRA